MPRAWSPPCDRCLSPTRHGRYCRRLSPGGTTRCNRFLCQVCRQLHLSYASCAEDGANFVRQPREEGPTPSGRPDGDKDLIVTCQKDGTSTDAVVANRVELPINAFTGDDERAPSLVVAADPSTTLGEAQAGASEALAAALSKGEEVACLSCLETLVPPIAFGTMEGSRQRPVSVGPHHTGDTTVHLLEDALMLAEKARGHVDVHIANRTLTDLQFEKANKWLQIECFEKYFMHSQALKERIRQFDRCPHQLSRSQKQAVRGSRRDAFKAWTKGLMGNTQLFHAVMRNGMFEVEDLQAFMVAFLQIRTEAETGASSGDSHSAAAPRLDDFLPRSVG